MTTRDAIIAEARAWLDAPVFHRGRSRVGGVDCLGLVIGVGVGSGALVEPGSIDVPDYGQLPNPTRLVAGLARFMLAIDLADAGDGDVLAISWGARALPMHLAIRATYQGRATIIHAFPKARPARVVEMSFAGDWIERTCSAWRFPGLS